MLRTGEFRDSIRRTVRGDEGFVGTDDPRGPYFEFGMKNMPPRPVLGPALMTKEKELKELFHHRITGVLKLR